jgi:hypothetical protein
MTDNDRLTPNEGAIEIPAGAADGGQAEGAERGKAEHPFRAFLEHQKRAFEETGRALDALLPEGFKQHSKEARREFLRGVSVLVDAAVVELEKASKEADRVFKQMQQRRTEAPPPPPAPSRPSTTGPQKVKVEVE